MEVRRAGVLEADPGPRGIDSRDPALRLAGLLDSSTAMGPRDDSGVLAVRGTIDGVDAIAFCVDATHLGGALGAAGCARVVAAIEAAVAEGVPVVGVWHSSGVRLAEGLAALDGVGRVFRAIVAAAGKVARLSVVLGPIGGEVAMGPALSDLVVATQDVGGVGAHVVAADEGDALRRARRLVGLLGRHGDITPRAARAGQDVRALLPQATRLPYDVKPLIRAMVDTDAQLVPGFEELGKNHAPSVVTGLARLGGRTVGVVATNPIRGRLDQPSTEKAARFVRLCDSLAVPLVVLVDAPADHAGADLVRAFAEATVPRVTLITRKAHGGAYVAMNSRALGATAVYAWDDADCAVIDAKAAVRVLRRRELADAPLGERAALLERYTEEQARTAGGVTQALALGGVDAVIDPTETARRLAQAIADHRPQATATRTDQQTPPGATRASAAPRPSTAAGGDNGGQR